MTELEEDPAEEECFTAPEPFEMLEAYFAAKHAEKAHYPKTIDPIDPAIIGNANVALFCKFVRGRKGKPSPLEWAWGTVKLLEGGKGSFELVENPEGAEPQVFVSKDVQRALERDSPLSSHIPNTPDVEDNRKRTREDPNRAILLRLPRGAARRLARCGIFLVPKKDDVWRLVFDARPANRLLKRLEGFRLFGLKQLLGVMRSVIRQGEWWCRTFDFRHYFYQIPLPESLRTFFGVDVGNQGFVPQVLCMGFHSAPNVAQSLTWAAVLLHDLHDANDRPKYLKEWPSKAMPEYLVLVDAKGRVCGAIFVLLDNVMVVANDKEVVKYWEERIIRNTKLLRIVV
jgi:hypothetical protein